MCNRRECWCFQCASWAEFKDNGINNRISYKFENPWRILDVTCLHLPPPKCFREVPEYREFSLGRFTTLSVRQNTQSLVVRRLVNDKKEKILKWFWNRGAPACAFVYRDWEWQTETSTRITDVSADIRTATSMHTFSSTSTRWVAGDCCVETSSFWGG
jgi:hypothetical protein